MEAFRDVADMGRGGRAAAFACGLALTFTAGARAETMDAFLERMKDVNATLRLEEGLRGELESGNDPGIKAMARNIRRDDGAHIETLAKASQKLAMKIGPCQIAGVTLRTLILGLGEGRVRAERAGATFATRPRAGGELFGENMRRCEIIHRSPKTVRRVGTLCALEGAGDGCE